jgi:hypothetical protein
MREGGRKERRKEGKKGRRNGFYLERGVPDAGDKRRKVVGTVSAGHPA